MIQLGCVLARMGNHAVPAFVHESAPQLRQYFLDASSQDIDLQIDGSRLQQPILPGRAYYSALDLHQATRALTHNPAPPQVAERIAVIYANRYIPAHAGVFGMMFDRGFRTSDDPNENSEFTSSPREGCAIFVDAIAALRPNRFDFEREALFTTVHEMGHLFNLQHVATPSFMATSAADAPHPVEPFFKFADPHKEKLRHCSTSREVCPGGARFGGDNHWSDSASAPVTRHSRQRFGLELKLAMARTEFWHFEPVELEIELRVAPGLKRTFRVSNVVDPGYDEFVIWLESPSGERRRYRSPRYYCATSQALTIAPGASFLRDVSIFGEAGGYTFKSSGVWRIWAELKLSPQQSLRSNELLINIKPLRGGAAFERARAILSAPSAASLMYHRQLRGRSDITEPLIAVADAGNGVAAAGIEYALGRAMAERLSANEVRDAEAARHYLSRARDRSQLGARQRQHADRLLNEMRDSS